MERLGPGGKYRYSNHMSAKILNPYDDACKKLWRDEGEKLRSWKPHECRKLLRGTGV